MRHFIFEKRFGFIHEKFEALNVELYKICEKSHQEEVQLSCRQMFEDPRKYFDPKKSSMLPKTAGENREQVLETEKDKKLAEQNDKVDEKDGKKSEEKNGKKTHMNKGRKNGKKNAKKNGKKTAEKTGEKADETPDEYTEDNTDRKEEKKDEKQFDAHSQCKRRDRIREIFMIWRNAGPTSGMYGCTHQLDVPILPSYEYHRTSWLAQTQMAMRAEVKAMKFFKGAKGKQHDSPELAAAFEGHDVEKDWNACMENFREHVNSVKDMVEDVKKAGEQWGVVEKIMGSNGRVGLNLFRTWRFLTLKS
ncbi:hypothetical protein OEA41_003273 [Lepraria neglecta]|uniref:Uncharacterized protein n=1 Tax=Lepraria neglecta TaxID=209136 RepID=A0AAE0DIR3_9LECA|nr:hypothetical protein OEA41_003273 [Lepraria neglecta]